MATFPSITPSYNARKSSGPTARVVRFGDGYEQRLVYGINQNPQMWVLTWANISETDADTIETFLSARGGSESFNWTPLGESSSLKFVCANWNKSIAFVNRATIQATFRQVFEP